MSGFAVCCCVMSNDFVSKYHHTHRDRKHFRPCGCCGNSGILNSSRKSIGSRNKTGVELIIE